MVGTCGISAERFRPRNHLGADHATRATAILNHNGLAQRFSQTLRQRTRDQVRAATRRERHNDAHGLDGIILGTRHV